MGSPNGGASPGAFDDMACPCLSSVDCWGGFRNPLQDFGNTHPFNSRPDGKFRESKVITPLRVTLSPATKRRGAAAFSQTSQNAARSRSAHPRGLAWRMRYRSSSSRLRTEGDQYSTRQGICSCRSRNQLGWDKNCPSQAHPFVKGRRPCEDGQSIPPPAGSLSSPEACGVTSSTAACILIAALPGTQLDMQGSDLSR